MASTINAKNTATGLVITSDSSGQLELQTLDTTKVTIATTGEVGIGMTPDGSSYLQLMAGDANHAPIELTSGTLMTTPDGGSFEYLTNVGYFTPTNNNRAVMCTEHFVARTGTKTMTSNTSLQSVFGGGTGGLTNGALTVDGSTSYYFECYLNLTSMSATSGNMGFSLLGAGTATLTSVQWVSIGQDNTAGGTAQNMSGVYSNTAGQTGNIFAAATATAAAGLIKGIFRVNAGGTIIPSIQLTTAAAAVIGANCWFKCYPVGSDTVISVGNWS